MASGRVGGTKSKVSGKVGDNVYQIVRNPDGTYSQIVRAKGTVTVNRTTPRLQVQRMCTGMVESMMKQLSPVAKISMQSAANKSKSLNAFSSFNLQKVLIDCKAHWYGNSPFVYPEFNSSDGYMQDLGGLWMISSGTLQFNLFNGYEFNGLYSFHWPDFSPRTDESLILTWEYKPSIKTVGDFFRSYRITRLDTIVFCAFLNRWYNIDYETGDAEEENRHLYMILKPNPTLSDNTQFTPDMISHLFTVETNYKVTMGWKDNNELFGYGFSANNMIDISEWGYAAAFSISYLDGRKKISYSAYKPLGDTDKPWLWNQQPYQVFGSWMGERWNRNFPSPFQ